MDPAPQQPKHARAGLLHALRATLRLSWGAAPRAFLGILALTVVASALPPVVVLLSKRLVDQIVRAQAGSIGFRAILPTALAMGVLAAAQHVLSDVSQNRRFVFSRRVGQRAEQRFLRAISEADMARFDDPGWHDRVAHVSRELFARPAQMTYLAMGMAGSIVTLAGMLGILFGLHPLLLALALVATILPIPVQRRINRRIYEFWFGRTSDEREQQYLRWMLQNTGAAKDIRAFGLEEHLLDRHARLADDRIDELGRVYRAADRWNIITGVLSGAALGTAYLFVASRGAAGALTPGSITALLGAIASVTTQIGALTGSMVAVEEHAAFTRDYFEFLKMERLLPISERPEPLPASLAAGVRFEGVTFSYPAADEPALSGLDLSLRPGELLALVGDNGAGKTTIVKLLMRLYDPQAGSIRIGGVDVRDADPADVRSRVGVLFQDYLNMAFTVRTNVGMGRPSREPTDEAIWTSVQAAQATDVVKRLANGLDSFVGRMFEGGKDLSGGEWQRLAFARLVFRQADVWVLDEPTSSLDPEAEAAIFAELKDQLQGRMGIVISHRFSTVRVADRIAVIQDGRVSEQGTHDELVALGGRYAQLFELQAAAYR